MERTRVKWQLGCSSKEMQSLPAKDYVTCGPLYLQFWIKLVLSNLTSYVNVFLAFRVQRRRHEGCRV